MQFRTLAFALAVPALAAPVAAAESPSDILMGAAFVASDRASALAKIERALRAAEAAIARNPKDQEAKLQRAMAISYRGKLTRSRGDVIAARREFEAVAAANPRNAEAQLALAGWHLESVAELGPLLARTALGARKPTGLQMLNRALALGGRRALFPAFASLIHIQTDPDNVAAARKFAEAALKAEVADPVDRMMQRQAAALLPALRRGDGKAAARTAKLLLPFGRVR
jgi:hypothetical protein